MHYNWLLFTRLASLELSTCRTATPTSGGGINCSQDEWVLQRPFCIPPTLDGFLRRHLAKKFFTSSDSHAQGRSYRVGRGPPPDLGKNQTPSPPACQPSPSDQHGNIPSRSASLCSTSRLSLNSPPSARASRRLGLLPLAGLQPAFRPAPEPGPPCRLPPAARPPCPYAQPASRPTVLRSCAQPPTPTAAPRRHQAHSAAPPYAQQPAPSRAAAQRPRPPSPIAD
jgi:hypothetical protein